jgi:hypothetical protein
MPTPDDAVVQIAENTNFFRRIATILLVGLVLAGGAFGAREYSHHQDAETAARDCATELISACP